MHSKLQCEVGGNRTVVVVQVVLGGLVCYADVDVNVVAKNGGGYVA